MDVYSSKTPSLYTRKSYMESHQAGYVMNPAYVYDDQIPASMSRSHYSNPSTERTGTYHSIEDFRSIKFKQKSTQKRAIIIVILAIVLVVIIATVVTASVVLSRADDKKDGPTTQQITFQGEGTLTGKVWSPDYLDKNSQLYRSTATEFINKVANQFSQSELKNNYQSTVVNGYREGSVVILFSIVMITDVSQSQITTNSIINVMILVPNVTAVIVVEMGASSTTTTSTTTTTTSGTTSTITATNTTTLLTSTTTTQAAQTTSTTSTTLPPTSTTSSTKAPTTTTTTTTTTQAPTTTLPPTTMSSTTSTTMAPTQPKTTTVTTTTEAPVTTTMAPTTTSTSTVTTTTSTTTGMPTPIPAPTTTTSTTSTTVTTTSTLAPTTSTVTTTSVPTTTSIIPVCTTGFIGYKLLLEYRRDFMQIYLDITSPTTVLLKQELEAWGNGILSTFNVDDDISVFAVTDFGPPNTNSSYTLVTVHVCVDSSVDINTVSTQLGLVITILPDYNNVGFSDLFDATLRYSTPFDEAMTDVTSTEFINTATSVQAVGEAIISAVANLNSDITILAFYVNKLEADDDESNTVVTVRVATSITSPVTDLDLTGALNLALLGNSDLSLISVVEI